MCGSRVCVWVVIVKVKGIIIIIIVIFHFNFNCNYNYDCHCASEMAPLPHSRIFAGRGAGHSNLKNQFDRKKSN